MKKKVFSIIGAVAIVAAVVFNVSLGLRGETLSELALANIEALAKNENDDNMPPYGSCGWNGATRAPCLINWSGTCSGSCNSFFESFCTMSAYYSWCRL